MAAAVEIRDVHLGAGKEILRSISVCVEAGENFVLIGPSGEGKSTLLKVMAGLLVPTRGHVLIEGQDLSGLDADQRQVLSRRMGMLFQKNALFDSLTVFENVCFPMRETTSLPDKEITATAEYFLKAVDLLQARDLYPDEISGGMQKRLGIARALALRPEIVFYDDPTAGLDPITSRRIIDLIRTLQKEFGSTVIAITNDMSRAFQMADRIGVVFRGELLVTGSPDRTRNHPDPRVRQFIQGKIEGPLTRAGAPRPSGGAQ